MSGFTPKLPLVLDEQDGAYLLIKNYRELVSQNFKNLLLTAPGERIMDINFGVGLRNYLFRNAGFQLEQDILDKIMSQVEKYMPFLAIQDIQFNESENYTNLLNVRIFYYIGPLNISDNLSISLPIN